MIDPALMQQLIAQRQAQMGQQGSSPFQFGMPRGIGMPPGGMQQGPQGMGQGGINPYLQMLMQRGGMPQGLGMGPRLGPMGQGGPGGMPMPQGGGSPQARPQQGGPQGGGGGGGFDAYRRMFQGPPQGQGDQQQRTPTGLPRLQQMGMPTGQQGPGAGRPY